jgi:catechol 2,3-dioxygenase-like lactoylglutathione lyase family enzyme
MFCALFRRALGFLVAVLLPAVSATLTLPCLRADEPAAQFSKPVIDIGVVVSDLDKSAAFYTNVIGFREIAGFNVPPDMGKKIGLTDRLGVKIRVFELGEGNSATKLKLMSFPDASVAKPDRRFIHSTLGLNYLTIYPSDITPLLRRLKAASVKLLGESPVDLGGGTFLVTFQDPDGTFIELVGPAKTS